MAKFFVYPFAVAGVTTPIPDPTQVSGSVSYQQGFGIDYTLPYGSNPNALPVPLGSMNQLFNDITSAIQQWQVHGIPDFITTLDNDGSPYPYDIYSLVRFDPGTGVQVYISTISNNTTDPTNTTNWAQVSGGGGFGQPPGSFLWYGGTTAPNGYLACDGSTINRIVYADLFAAIGTIWGAGDGSTTFNIPLSARNTLVGSGGAATLILGNTVGSSGGEEAHVQQLNEMATHHHSTTFNQSGGSGGSNTLQQAAISGTATINTNSQGSSDAANVVQPSLVALLAIKY